MDFKGQVIQSLQQVLPVEMAPEKLNSLLEIPKSGKLGDLAFPTFILAKEMHQSPVEIAADLAKKIDAAAFEKVQAVGPYLNFFLDEQKFSQQILETILTQQAKFGEQDLGQGGNVPIDMSSPNIAKPMSMGHLRSTVIGNSLAKLLKKVNYQPIKINHLGDWGTQFGKLITAYKLWGSEEEVKKDPINKLLEYYVHFHQVDVKHPELDDQAREWFRKLEDGDPEAMELWKWFRKISLQTFMKVYDRLGVEFDSYNGEAFYNDKMAEIVEILADKGLLHESRGAQIVDLSKYHLNPALIKKTDGATLYITRDLAAAVYRKRTYHFVQSLYVVGSEQTNHFKQLKAVLHEMGADWSDQIHHIPFGLITSGGHKLSTRAGRVILLEKVLDDAVALAQKQIEQKNPGLKHKAEVAKAVGVGAVVFHDLKNNRMDNFDFNLEEVVRFEGETGPYVQYTHARAESILRKSGKNLGELPDQLRISSQINLEAWGIVKKLADFPTMIERAVTEYEPSVIAKYALHLAKAFNQYYAHNRVLNDDAGLNGRLALVEAVAIVLKEALRLLGVKAPDEM